MREKLPGTGGLLNSLFWQHGLQRGAGSRSLLCPAALCRRVPFFFLVGAEELPPPSNLSYSFIQICTVNWTWRAPENVSRSCDLVYSSDIFINEVSQNQKVGSSTLPAYKSQAFPTCLAGIPGTAAVNLKCIWHNLEYMECKWLAGKNARSDTNYTLFYWLHICKTIQYGTSFPTSNIQFQAIFSILLSVKPATPKAVALSKVNDEIRLEWSQPHTFPASCLYYEVEYHSGDKDTAQTIKVTILYLQLPILSYVEYNHTSIPSVDPKTKYTFKVRAKPKPECYSSELFSDWSEEKSIGKNTSSWGLDTSLHHRFSPPHPNCALKWSILDYCPFHLKLCFAVFRRLKILILPPIPDPREILKRMFGEQNEDSQGGVKEDAVNAYNRLIKEEEIHSLVLTETLESSYPENENR
uniref:Interleukin 13 receptor subunit alpha 1 n=1 Tax=Nothoprocta perdicaria TaxID=30464 RepID=A0A8C6YZ02_NOTPE